MIFRFVRDILLVTVAFDHPVMMLMTLTYNNLEMNLLKFSENVTFFKS